MKSYCYTQSTQIGQRAAGAAACGYAVVKRDTWEASQSMMVRAEAGNGDAAVGRFRDVTEMKNLQVG